MILFAVATVLVVGTLWVLVRCDIVPFARLCTTLFMSSLLVFVVITFAHPLAYQDVVAWFVDRTSTVMIELIQPAFDEIVPPTTRDTPELIQPAFDDLVSPTTDLFVERPTVTSGGTTP